MEVSCCKDHGPDLAVACPACQSPKLNWKKLEGGTQPGTAPTHEICQCDKTENKIVTLYFQ